MYLETLEKEAKGNKTESHEVGQVSVVTKKPRHLVGAVGRVVHQTKSED